QALSPELMAAELAAADVGSNCATTPDGLSAAWAQFTKAIARADNKQTVRIRLPRRLNRVIRTACRSETFMSTD
ncbi:MAG: hypothetical protein ACREDQ_00950, partial [Limisphaerales bacterium]